MNNEVKFLQHRTDLEHIAKFIPYGSKVLDVGCGEGLLLEYLVDNRDVDGRGIEIIQENVSTCVRKGLSVIQGNADNDLQYYGNKIFDYAIATSSLQATHHPKQVLIELLRIANHVIISVPNFAHWYNRFHLSIKGRMPVSKYLSYEWYNTPNIHFCTIKDFRILCKEVGATIEQQYYIIDDKPIQFCGASPIANFIGKQGLFILSKPE